MTPASFIPPQFVTFTGADDSTDVSQMMTLSKLYPIEWGILFSAEREGGPRYPSAIFVDRLRIAGAGLNLSAHICGGYCKELLGTGSILMLDPILKNGVFKRVQINTKAPDIDLQLIRTWADSLGVEVIVQCRSTEAFPESNLVHWLFDASGGRGVVPDKWPPHPEDLRLHGYAGGIGPGNAMEVVKTISALPGLAHYTLDMESSLRDANDQFDISTCEAVCRAIFGSLTFKGEPTKSSLVGFDETERPFSELPDGVDLSKPEWSWFFNAEACQGGIRHCDAEGVCAVYLLPVAINQVIAHSMKLASLNAVAQFKGAVKTLADLVGEKNE